MSTTATRRLPSRRVPQRVPYPQTPETAAAWIRAHGVVVSELARVHGIPRLVLVDLLRGKLRGHRGQAHDGAILLGLKPEPSEVLS